MRLFVERSARRAISLAVLLFFTIPFGLSVVGCGHKTAPPVYCNGGDTGPAVGQLVSIQLSPALAVVGESLNYGEMGQALSAIGYDCKGNVVSTGTLHYGSSANYSVPSTTNNNFVDVNPSTGQACAGTWNRNTGGGVANYTICTAPTTTPPSSVYYITATGNGVTSNAIPVYIHPVISSIVFGAGASCSTDPSTTCCPADPTTVVTGVPEYDGSTCVSQNNTVQVALRAYTSGTQPTFAVSGWSISSTGNTTTFTVPGTSLPSSGSVVSLSGFPNSTFFNGQSGLVTATQVTNLPYTFTVDTAFNQASGSATESGTATEGTNISCEIGHFTLGEQGATGIVSFDQNGVATALAPGSVALTAALSNSSNASTVGFFSTCPPAKIVLTPVGNSSSTSINVPLNDVQPFTATVTDTAGNPITGADLEYESTTPQTLAAGTGTATPTYPGDGTITAVCQPPSCNPAPFSQLGYLGNGKPVTSNGIEVTTSGTSSTVLYVGSTQSQYLLPYNFSTGVPGALVKLPFVPNSMVMSEDGTTIYMGSSGGLMTFSTSSNSVTTTNLTIQGTVISVSPNNADVIVTDPTRQTISLVAGGAVTSTYGGVATSAAWSPDSNTVYITTTGNNVLTYSSYTDWQSTPIAPSSDSAYTDVAVMVPSIGAYFAGPTSTDGRSYCSLTTTASAGTPPSETNQFAPLSDTKPVPTQVVAATDDGNHILGASTASVSDLFFSPALTGQTTTTQKNGPQGCTSATANVTFATTPNTIAFAGITPTAITGIDPASNSDIAFVTFTGTGNGLLPYYLPSTTGPAGSLQYLKLSTSGGTPTAPVAGVFSTDNNTFYVGTAGDNLIHLITLSYPSGSAPSATDSSQINPQLPNASGSGDATPNLIAQHPVHTQT